MRILLLGGTRFIGPHVVKRLAEYGHEVAIFNRGLSSGEAPLPGGMVSIKGDRSKLGEYREAFHSFAPDVIIDLFPYTEADAHLLMETFQDLTGRVVAVSSCDVYQAFGRVNGIETGPVEDGPLTEDSPLCQKRYPFRGVREDRSDYDKVLVEKVVLSHKRLPGTIVRLPMVYGPGDYQHRLYPYLQQMRDGRKTILMEEGFASWSWARGYVEDIAEAIRLAATHDVAKGQIYHVAEPDCLTMKQWIERIAAQIDWQGEVISVPAADLPAHLVPQINNRQHICLDTGKIRRELGYQETITDREAMRRTIEWEIANPPEGVMQMINYTEEDEIIAKLGIMK